MSQTRALGFAVSFLVTQRFSGLVRWHFGHRVSDTSPYRGHEGREAELELNISR